VDVDTEWEHSQWVRSAAERYGQDDRHGCQRCGHPRRARGPARRTHRAAERGELHRLEFSHAAVRPRGKSSRADRATDAPARPAFGALLVGRVARTRMRQPRSPVRASRDFI
jgi:hypothetical protein